MIYGMDKDYAKCCVDYIKLWIEESNAHNYEITDEVIEYIIMKGGDGLKELESRFYKIIDTAQEYQVEKIDKAFIDKVFS